MAQVVGGSGSADAAAAATEAVVTVPPPLRSEAATRKTKATTAKTTTNTNTNTTHVVIASFGEPEPYHAVSLYFASRLAGATLHHVIMHTYGKGHEPGELNLKVSKDGGEEGEEGAGAAAAAAAAAQRRHPFPSPSLPWRTIYHRLSVHRHNIDLSTEESYHALARSYLHSSAREVDYELLCFARFIGLHRFCTERGINELTFLDADVIVFDREFLTKVRIPANHSLYTVHDRSSFLASMTCSSIGDFVDYMVDFYQQEDRQKIVSTIDTYGDDELDVNKLQGLRNREPAFDALRVRPKLFSDMYLFERFLNDQLAHSRARGAEGEEEGKGGEGTKEVGVKRRGQEGEQKEGRHHHHDLLGGIAKQGHHAGIVKTPQATTLPLRLRKKVEGKEGETAATAIGSAAVLVDGDTAAPTNPPTPTTPTTTTTPIPLLLPPYVYYWTPGVEKYSNYFTLMVNMRYVTHVPKTRAWLCLNQALFDAHFKINITSQLARKDGGETGASFEPFAGAHFQGDCKSKMMQLLYGDVMRAIEATTTTTMT